MEAATSGIEVPAATMVRPITRSLTPMALAKATAAVTSHSEPSTRASRPAGDQAQLHRPSLLSQSPGRRPGLGGRIHPGAAAAVSRRDCTIRKTV
jgi:hypothetical protein